MNLKILTLIIYLIGHYCCWLQAQNENQFQLLKDNGYQLLVSYPFMDSVSAEKDLKVYVGENPGKGFDPVTGTYHWSDSTVTFKPSFGFQAGMSYTAILNGSDDHFHFSIPKIRPTHFTEVIGFYPSGNTVPANLLKVYIQLSQPMSEGMAYQHIHLLNEKGDTVYQPFLALQPELWDEERQRLTLWLDPGRIKRDLGPNLLHGTPLESNQTYRICVSKNWEDIQGFPLEKGVDHSFFVSQPDRIKPDVKNWIVEVPNKKTKEAIVIHFKEPLDFALAKNVIHVLDQDGQILTGEIILKNEEKTWQFRPNISWKTGTYQIRIEGILEDLAGNSLNRLFDRDLANPDQLNLNKDFYWLPLEIKE